MKILVVNISARVTYKLRRFFNNVFKLLPLPPQEAFGSEANKGPRAKVK